MAGPGHALSPLPCVQLTLISGIVITEFGHFAWPSLSRQTILIIIIIIIIIRCWFPADVAGSALPMLRLALNRCGLTGEGKEKKKKKKKKTALFGTPER
jgi:hypothetical protein